MSLGHINPSRSSSSDGHVPHPLYLSQILLGAEDRNTDCGLCGLELGTTLKYWSAKSQWPRIEAVSKPMMNRPGDDDTNNDVDPSERSRDSLRHQLMFFFISRNYCTGFLWKAVGQKKKQLDKMSDE